MVTAYVELEPAGFDYPRNSPSSPGFDLPKYPWVARLCGAVQSGERTNFDREFMEKQIDYSRANSKGSRGVFFCYMLYPGIYEANVQPRPNHPYDNKRIYFEVGEDGRRIDIDRDEALRRLGVER